MIITKEFDGEKYVLAWIKSPTSLSMIPSLQGVGSDWKYASVKVAVTLDFDILTQEDLKKEQSKGERIERIIS